MKKIKIEICDTNGEQITVAMSGQVVKDRLLQILQIFDAEPTQETPQKSSVMKTVKEKLMDLITTDLNKVWFTSKDLSLLYQDRYNESIKASTISTYLTRLYSNGYLERKGNRSCWQYRLVSSVSTNQIDFKVVSEL